jgi:hypothetical protein
MVQNTWWCSVFFLLVCVYMLTTTTATRTVKIASTTQSIVLLFLPSSNQAVRQFCRVVFAAQFEYVSDSQQGLVCSYRCLADHRSQHGSCVYRLYIHYILYVYTCVL